VTGKDAAKKKVLVSEPLSETGLAVLAKAGFPCDVKTGLTREQLLAEIGGYDALVVRSATQVDRELLAAGKRLKVVGRAGVGLDNVDLKAATELGILVVNAPSGNVVSAAEHTIALLLALLRKVPEAQASVKAGEWKRTKFVGTELMGKTVGLVGLGQVGARVAARLKPWSVRLLAYDPFVSPEKAAELGVVSASLDEVLETSDVVSLHTPVTPETKGLLGEARLARMKKGVFIVNCARGALIDEAALVKALDEGRVGGAALDVFSVEPPKDFTLMQHPKIVATPHLGASTVEAQDRVAVETVELLVEVLSGSPFVAAVNLPFPPGGDPHGALPWMKLAEGVGELAVQLLPEAPTKIDVQLAGVKPSLQKAVSVAAVKGALSRSLAEGVNLVNAATVAKQNGIAVSETVHAESVKFASLLTVTVSSGKGERSVSGTFFGEEIGRIVAIDGYPMEFTPEGSFLCLVNKDVPGVIGRIGTFLGNLGINIGDLALSRAGKGRALAVVKFDRPEGFDVAALLTGVARLEGIESARFVTLS
jgi:D-3-phosphoglycerate dehydrogenase / 2-oxoglutarate reductase